MINAVLTGAVAGLVVVIALLVGLGVFYHVAKRKLRAVFIQHFTSSDTTRASNFALLCQSIAGVFGSEIAQRLKAAFLGIESVAARNESKEKIQAVTANSPLLAGIMAGFPTIAKRIIKNPAMGQFISSVLANAGKPKENQPSNHHDESVKFNF